MTVPAILASKVLVQRHRIHPKHVEPLAAVFERCHTQTMPPGRTICDEGGQASELFILLSGRVIVKKKDYQGVSKQLATMKAPSIFGHMALVGQTLRTATCITDTECQVAWLDRRLFETLMGELGEQGKAFRWLIVSSMLMQHGKASREIRRLTGQAHHPQIEDDDIDGLTASLHGW